MLFFDLFPYPQILWTTLWKAWEMIIKTRPTPSTPVTLPKKTALWLSLAISNRW